ncbi:MAG: alcohol dehydrogenase catalytic domain-containing protein [Thermomicrobiales bacterium]
MKALRWYGKNDVRVENVPEPTIEHPRDAIVRITTTAICGSDLHLYDGYIPTMEQGDILGHEFMGEVVALGKEVTNLKIGDRVVVPFTISCGGCFFCQKQLWSLCDNSNPNAELAAKAYGYSPAGLFGYSHMLGGYPGGQAEYARVPFADVGPIKIPDGLADDESSSSRTSSRKPATWPPRTATSARRHGGGVGAGPVSNSRFGAPICSARSAIIAIDQVADRLQLAREGKAETIDPAERGCARPVEGVDRRAQRNACIDAVSGEAHGMALDAVVDRVKAATFMATDRPHALREAIQTCARAGTVSIPASTAACSTS